MEFLTPDIHRIAILVDEAKKDISLVWMDIIDNLLEEDYAIIKGIKPLPYNSKSAYLDPPALDSFTFFYTTDQIRNLIITGNSPLFRDMSSTLQIRTIITIIVPKILEWYYGQSTRVGGLVFSNAAIVKMSLITNSLDPIKSLIELSQEIAKDIINMDIRSLPIEEKIIYNL